MSRPPRGYERFTAEIVDLDDQIEEAHINTCMALQYGEAVLSFVELLEEHEPRNSAVARIRIFLAPLEQMLVDAHEAVDRTRLVRMEGVS